MSDESDLDRLCAAAGIERVYHDQFGTRREVSAETARAVAAALDVSGAEALLPPLLEPAAIRLEGEAEIGLAVNTPAEAESSVFAWTLVEEGGERHEGTCCPIDLAFETAPDGTLRRWLALPMRLRSGYHRLNLRCEAPALAAETLIIVAPRRAYLPDALEHGPGIWGLAVQLYALRSATDWGIGDFACLEDAIRRAAAAGAGAVGVNPLHALALDEPERASPYSPSSRAFLNPLYIALEAVPDFAECDAARTQARSPDFAKWLDRLKAADIVDYRGVAALKLRVLAMLHASFERMHRRADTGRGRVFAAFLAAEGESLRRFCIFQALRETRGRGDPAQRDWRNWPGPLRDPNSAAVAGFAAANEHRISFFAYCEWIARLQFEACAAAARDAGMPVGLYVDLAVGVDAAAGDAWAAQETVVAGWSMGAPPDAWNRLGQNWGLVPLNPLALRRRAYQPFIELVRRNMRGAGALRIDHILGFWRSFWIRQGRGAAEGAYVRYPFGDFVAILALESRRWHCIVIGEDLGTVPAGLREALAAAGILSYRLLYFEHGADGKRARPADYPRLALVAVGTHDLPPLAGYWSGTDIAVRRALGHLASDADEEKERWYRGEDRAALAALFREAGVGSDAGENAAPIESAYRFLARTPGRIVMVQIEDVLEFVDQPNVPGTVDEFPNWRRRLPLNVDAMFADPRMRKLAAALNAERPPLPRVSL
jgi:4-alpha-glucanotransferase